MKSALALFVVGLPILCSATDPVNAVEQEAALEVERALSGGLEAVDFPALQKAFAHRRSFSQWPYTEVLLDRLAAARSADPLMIDVVRVMRAHLAVEQGRPEAARELFHTMGGLSRWWSAGPVDLEELEDFSRVATYPSQQTSWRAVPGTNPLGWVQLQGLAWPARRQMLYLATSIESDDTQPAAIRLGVAQVGRLWVNGELVLTTDHPLRASEDQVSVGCWLQRGVNSIVFAVASESSDWWLRARVTAPDGSAATGVRELAASPTRVQPVDRQTPEIKTLKTTLRTAVERGNEGSQLALAALLVDRSSEPMSSGMARSACRQAREDDAIAARYFELLATTEAGDRRDLLLEAIGLGAPAVPFRIHLARWYHARGMSHQASDLIADKLDTPAVKALALEFESDRWGPVALQGLQTLAEQFPECLDVLLSLARTAKANNRLSLLRDALGRLDALAPGHPAVESLAADAAGLCDDELRAEQLQRALDQDPNRSDVRGLLAKLYANAGRSNLARDLLETGLDRCPTNVDLLLESAQLLHRVGDENEAEARVREVLQRRPQNRRAEQLLLLLGGAEEHDDWRLSVDKLRTLSDQADHLDGPNVALVDSTSIHFLPGNLTEKRVQQAFFVRDAARSRTLEIHRIPYIAESQRLRILAARAIHSDGGETGAHRRDTPRLSEPEFNLYYDTRLRVLRFDDLADGDLIEISYVLTETLEANETGAYEGGILYLGSTTPTLRAEVEMVAPSEQMPAWELVHLTGHPERTVDADGVERLRWVFADLPAETTDVPLPPRLLVQPHFVYSNHGQWGDLADWYGRHVAPRIRASREVEEMALDLVEGVEDRRERISKIYRFVTNEIRYVGLEFGEHRYRPFSADWVLTHKMGDCKDTAGLLVALYSSIGIPARMVMIRTSDLGPVTAEMAVMQDFNHAIAYLPEDDLWLDGTAAGHDPYPPPGIDQGAWVLVADGPRSAPQTTPLVGSGAWGYHYTLRHKEGNRFDLVLRTEDTGEAATRRRGRFAGRRTRSVFSRWLQTQFPGAEMVGDAKLSLALGTNPAVMEVKAVVDRSTLLAGGGLKTYPGTFELDTELTPTADRSSPLQLPARPDLSWSVTVSTEGDAPSPREPVHMDSPWGSLEIEYSTEGSELHVKGLFRLTPALVSAQEAHLVRQFLVDVRRILERPIGIR